MKRLDMARKGKSAKLAVRTGNTDQLIENLPDAALFAIICKLTLKECVRLSVLSKQWRFIWTWHPNLLFDGNTIIGEKNTSKFVEILDQFMDRRNSISTGIKVDSLAINYPLSKDYAPQLDKWIGSSISKGVENIDIDLSDDPCDARSATSGGEKYEFPCWLLKCNVKHLSLASCRLGDFSSFTSLITIQLHGVNISDGSLKNLLSSCLSLDRLSLYLCADLVNPAIAGSNLRLKCLTVEDCFRLEKMEIAANNLSLFEYTGNFISFYFERVPSLTSVFLSFTGDRKLDAGLYSLTTFARDLPQLETLNLVSILSIKVLRFPENVTAFSNIKHLVLTVCPFDDDDRLLWPTYILKAFPLLKKLQLDLFCPSFIKQSSEVKRVLPWCPHKHLKELEINGFYGNRHEVELLKYLLKNLIELKVLEISPCSKIFGGFGKWFYEPVVANWYKSRSYNVWELLHDIVPSHVHFKILNLSSSDSFFL